MKEMHAVGEPPGVDGRSRAILSRLGVHGGRFGYAEEDPDGRLRAQVRIPPDEMIWDPSIVIMPRAGTLELVLVNDDQNTHCALLPSNGDQQFLWLPNHSRGTATLELDGPGCHWFSSIIGNDEGQGLIGAIVVLGDTPPEARLDRPPQPRP
jgi:PQQ system protein